LVKGEHFGSKDDHEEIAKRAKQIFKTKFKNHAQTKGLSGADIDELEFFIEEYVKTDAISISSILGHTYGLPYAPIGSIDYIIQQEYKNLEYKIK
jgi:glycogen debranching enzyme